jgi:hypothetical protein
LATLLIVDFPQAEIAAISPQGIAQRRGHQEIFAVTIVAAFGPTALIVPGARRPGVLVLRQVFVALPVTIAPALVVATQLPVAMGVDRVVAIRPRTHGKPRQEPSAGISGPVVIAEIVVIASRPDEEVLRQNPHVDEHAGGVNEVRLPIDRLVEVDGREQHPPAGQRVIPVAVDKQAAARCPDIVRGDPDPIGRGLAPVAAAPLVPRIAVDPATGNPEMVGRRRGLVRAVIDALGRNGQIT